MPITARNNYLFRFSNHYLHQTFTTKVITVEEYRHKWKHECDSFCNVCYTHASVAASAMFARRDYTESNDHFYCRLAKGANCQFLVAIERRWRSSWPSWTMQRIGEWPFILFTTQLLVYQEPLCTPFLAQLTRPWAEGICNGFKKIQY